MPCSRPGFVANSVLTNASRRNLLLSAIMLSEICLITQAHFACSAAGGDDLVVSAATTCDISKINADISPIARYISRIPCVITVISVNISKITCLISQITCLISQITGLISRMTAFISKMIGSISEITGFTEEMRGSNAARPFDAGPCLLAIKLDRAANRSFPPVPSRRRGVAAGFIAEGYELNGVALSKGLTRAVIEPSECSSKQVQTINGSFGIVCFSVTCSPFCQIILGGRCFSISRNTSSYRSPTFAITRRGSARWSRWLPAGSMTM